MRKLLLSLTVIAGAVAAGGAHASVAVAQPVAIVSPAVMLGAPSAQVETVQYYGYRGRGYRRAYWHHREYRRWHHRGRY